jgi:hypothetical protein
MKRESDTTGSGPNMGNTLAPDEGLSSSSPSKTPRRPILDQVLDYRIASTAAGISFPHLSDQVFPSTHLCSRSGDKDHRTSSQAALSQPS